MDFKDPKSQEKCTINGLEEVMYPMIQILGSFIFLHVISYLCDFLPWHTNSFCLIMSWLLFSIQWKNESIGSVEICHLWHKSSKTNMALRHTKKKTWCWDTKTNGVCHQMAKMNYFSSSKDLTHSIHFHCMGRSSHDIVQNVTFCVSQNE